jgi:ribosomal protein L14E/L6E/L27E
VELVKGMVVKSTAGHDSGNWFVVMKIDREGFAYIADGRNRKLASPKKKNALHLTKTKEVHNVENDITDKKLRELLHNRNFPQMKTNKTENDITGTGRKTTCQKTM